MSKKILVDATHEEETRVAVLENNKLEEFEYESQFRKPLKGSIFLAKVTRVEPSLQAAFVNFGGNRHGFLPFSEIHPDYFRIPISDREALMAEQEELLAQAQQKQDELDREEEEDMAAQEAGTEESSDDLLEEGDISEDGSEEELEAEADSEEEQSGDSEATEEGSDEESEAGDAEGDDSDEEGDQKKDDRRGGRGRRGRGRRNNRSKRSEKIETPEEAERRFRFNLRRKYKIQEVIKRGQIMLIQVSKEERGNKGAAVGTYLSLPGRYCVLMPNSPRAGGVSRKIANYKDRNRMREIMKDLEVPKGMSVILRTAGLSRTKTEIKRDLDYLIKLWNSIRELTLESSAPALVYEEADLIKRIVRDIYTRDVDEIQVAGSEAFKTAKNFMKMMIPSHVKKVVEYTDVENPLFNKYRVERQIAEIGETQVTLPSGGYLVINPTEALVSIDVNSGRSTKERHIEETALKTNLEAAEEVARQLRLRDLGGLVVIDFIDMEDRRNNGKVERKMRDALSVDRARVQVGRISSFGLMELSRQRLNPSLTESQFELCPHCEGTGRIRTADATSIMVLRAIEDEGIKNRAAQVIVHVSNAVALYLLNYKRAQLLRLEERYDFQILIRVDETVGASKYRVEVSKPLGNKSEEEEEELSEEDRNKSSRSRRGRRGGRGRNRRDNDDNSHAQDDDQVDDEQSFDEQDDTNTEEEQGHKDDRSKKHSNRRFKKNDGNKKSEDKKSEESSDEADDKKGKAAAKKSSSKKKDEVVEDAKEEKSEDNKPKKRGGRKPKKSDDEKEKVSSKKAISNDDEPSSDAKDAAAAAKAEASKHEVVNQTSGEKKKGWWNKIKG